MTSTENTCAKDWGTDQSCNSGHSLGISAPLGDPAYRILFVALKSIFNDALIIA